MTTEWLLGPVRRLPYVLLSTCLAAGLWLGMPTAAHAQETDCTERLEQARAFYETRRYQETVDRLSACLWSTDLPVPYIEQAYRLLALSYLRMDDVPSARLAIVELIERSPGYEPDPVHDLPSYVSLVRLVRQQLRVQARDTTTTRADATEEATAADLAPPADPAPVRDHGLGIALFGSVNVYHGERSAAGTLNETPGPGFGATLSYRLGPYVDLGLYYLAGRYPDLLEEKGTAYAAIDRAASSDWLHMTGLLASVRFLPRRRVTPVAQLGLNGGFSLINGTIRAGVGPRFGVGADVRLTPRLDATIRAGGLLVVPDTATDAASAASDISDLYTIATIGLRYHLSPPR